MAEQVPSDIIAGITTGPGTSAPGAAEHHAHHGRPASWAAVAIIIVGFIAGGIAMVTGPAWWLFWTGAGIVVIGGAMAAAVRILDDWY